MKKRQSRPAIDDLLRTLARLDRRIENGRILLAAKAQERERLIAEIQQRVDEKRRKGGTDPEPAGQP